MIQDYGHGHSGYYWPNGSSFSNISVGDGCASGCGSLACNFDATALVDNGSCNTQQKDLIVMAILSGDTYVIII